MEREEAEDLNKRHGGWVTGYVSKRKGNLQNIGISSEPCLSGSRSIIDVIRFQNHLLADVDVGGNKFKKAKELGYGSSYISSFGFLHDSL